MKDPKAVASSKRALLLAIPLAMVLCASEPSHSSSKQNISQEAIMAFVERVRQCWIIPSGAREANVVVRVRIRLNPKGFFTEYPTLLNNPAEDPTMLNYEANRPYEKTATSVVAALMGCQPYDMLPSDSYEVWKDLVLNFNPGMFSEQ